MSTSKNERSYFEFTGHCILDRNSKFLAYFLCEKLKSVANTFYNANQTYSRRDNGLVIAVLFTLLCWASVVLSVSGFFIWTGLDHINILHVSYNFFIDSITSINLLNKKRLIYCWSQQKNHRYPWKKFTIYLSNSLQ